MGDDYNSPETDSQRHKSRSKVGAKMCALHDYLLRRQYGYCLMAVVVGFHSVDVVICGEACGLTSSIYRWQF